MYSIEHDFRSGIASIIRDRDGARIPQDPRNGDFAEFLEWNAKRAEPLDLSAIEVELPPAVKSPEELAADYMARDLGERSPAWDALLPAATAWLLLRFVQDQPEQAQAILDAAGIAYKVRGAK